MDASFDVFCTRKIAASGRRLLEQAGIGIKTWEQKTVLSPRQLVAQAKDCQALIVADRNKIDRSFLEACRHLKVIALHSAGFDGVDIEAATQLGIPVGNAPKVHSHATADVAFLLLLAASRKAFFMHRSILAGDWSFFEPTAHLGRDLQHQTLGIFGMGAIGFRMARLCQQAYQMPILYHNRNRNREAEAVLGAEYVSFDALLQRSDIVSVHAPLTGQTRGKFNEDAFRQMKSSAIFINTARGAIHDELALIQALREQQIWGAGLDVSNPEPMRPDNPLLMMPNVAVTPHIGNATMAARSAMAEVVAQNIIAGKEGRRLPFPVNPEVEAVR